MLLAPESESAFCAFFTWIVLIGRVLSFQIVNLFCEIEIVLGFDYRVLLFLQVILRLGHQSVVVDVGA